MLDRLTPGERVAFVLHDLFAVPFEEIASLLGRTPAAARQLASRARRRVRDADPVADPDPATQRAIVDGGPGRRFLITGAQQVASRAIMFASPDHLRPVRVDGDASVAAYRDGGLVTVMGFTVAEGRIVRIASLSDPARVIRLRI